MPIINFENVSYSYPQTNTPALVNLNLSIEQGEFLAVMGPSGSGKTTFCKLINGIIPHLCGGRLTGNVTVDGVRTEKSSVPALAELAGLVMDDPDAQLFTSSVLSEAAFGPENLLVPPQEIEKRATEALASVGLAGFENRLPSTLSGGEKQRLAIASFLTMKSKILVLDEPLSRLDPEGASRVMSVLKDVKTRYGITIIMSSHDSKIIQEYADRVCILNGGRIVACDKSEKIFSNYKLLEGNGISSPKERNIYSVFKQITINSHLQTNNYAIEIKDFSFSFSKENPIIRNINLNIEDNDFTAIIGHNGCGKTTLLKSIAGLLRPESGDIVICGKSTKKMPVSEISKDVGFVMQNPDNQLFTDSVYKEVSFALKNSRLSKQNIEQRVDEALKIAGLQDKDAFPHALRCEDRTKIVIACVLAMGCKIILFDEADVGKDYLGCIKIMDIAKELHSKGYTIIFVTHNMSLVCKYAHRLIIMEKDGTISEWNRKR